MPRSGWLALLPLVFLGVTGCAWQDQNAPTTSWLHRSARGPIAGPHAILNVALIERPLGDDYVNRELWDSVDELVVDLDRRSALDDNGLRVGQLVGSPPEGFQALLLSKRSCSNPHALVIPPGRTMPLFLGPVLARSAYELVQGTQKTSVELDQARYCLEVTPTLTADGGTRLSFTPKVEHGEVLLPFLPSPDESSWTLRLERANKKYPDLSWEVTLAPNQYLIIGGRLDRTEALGHRAFVQQDDGNVQRLLVIRCGKGVAEETGRDLLDRHCPPLALQATVAPVARAQQH